VIALCLLNVALTVLLLLIAALDEQERDHALHIALVSATGAALTSIGISQ